MLRLRSSVALEQNNTITSQCDKPKSSQIAMGYFDNSKSSQIAMGYFDNSKSSQIGGQA
jgi:hypothetical protein